MEQVSAALSKETIQKMKHHYASSIQRTPPHALFRAKTPNVVITAYHSGKVLFQGKHAEMEAAKWGAAPIDKKTEKHSPNRSLPDFLQTSHIGSDESGTGDYFGPITTCAAYVREDQIALLKEIGIQDSKKITDQKIIELSKYITEMEIPYSLMILHNDKYNDLQNQGWTQGKMKTLLHHSSIERLLTKIADSPYQGILIDQFCAPGIFVKHLKTEGKVLPERTHFITKAENHSIAVATASVIARASFIHEMNMLSDMAGMRLAKGASHKVDQQAAELLQKYGRNFLKKIAKIHFANTKKAAHLL